MLCPSCKVELKMTDRQGVEIDYCPQCRGVWLDRGELDKIIDRSMEAEASSGVASSAPPAPSTPPPGQGYQYQPPFPQPSAGPHYGHGHHPKYYKKKSLLKELFDFD